MDWNTCINEGNSVRISSDKKRALFLTRQAENTIKVLEKIELDDRNASVFFANYYDALLEVMHAILYSAGYKVKNHYCVAYYLRDVMKDHESYAIFDRARIMRNSIIYYGEIFDKEVYRESIVRIISLINKMKKRID